MVAAYTHCVSVLVHVTSDPNDSTTHSHCESCISFRIMARQKNAVARVSIKTLPGGKGVKKLKPRKAVPGISAPAVRSGKHAVNEFGLPVKKERRWKSGTVVRRTHRRLNNRKNACKNIFPKGPFIKIMKHALSTAESERVLVVPGAETMAFCKGVPALLQDVVEGVLMNQVMGAVLNSRRFHGSSKDKPTVSPDEIAFAIQTVASAMSDDVQHVFQKLPGSVEWRVRREAARQKRIKANERLLKMRTAMGKKRAAERAAEKAKRRAERERKRQNKLQKAAQSQQEDDEETSGEEEEEDAPVESEAAAEEDGDYEPEEGGMEEDDEDSDEDGDE